MTRLVFFAGMITGVLLTWAICKRRTVQPVAPATEDRLDLAGMETRMKQSDREFRLERKNGKQS